MNKATEQVLRYFEFDHLPDGPRRDTSRQFYGLAHEMAESLPEIPATTQCLNDLLRAKDWAVRATLDL